MSSSTEPNIVEGDGEDDVLTLGAADGDKAAAAPAEGSPADADADDADDTDDDDNDDNDDDEAADDAADDADKADDDPKGKNKKKKSKGAKAKAKATAAVSKMLARLSDKQLEEFLARNPALAREVDGTAEEGESETEQQKQQQKKKKKKQQGNESRGKKGGFDENKERDEAGAGAEPDSGSDSGSSPSAAPAVPVKVDSEKARARLLRMLKGVSLDEIMTGMSTGGKNAKDMASYKFWKTQPVPSFDEGADAAAALPDGPLETKTVDQVSAEPGPLPDGFEWVTVDLTTSTEMDEVWALLNGHYVEDSNATFRFNYSPNLLRWALMAPGWRPGWHVGVRTTTSRRLVAFISAIPMAIRVRAVTMVVSEVNFLCVHKKLRNKRLAPVLIKEITRRCNRDAVWQGVYTGGVLLPRPVTTARYFHRPLRWARLHEMGFSAVPDGSKSGFQIRKYQLPEKTALRGLREMRRSDTAQVRDLLTRYLTRFEIAQEFSQEDFDHWFVDAAAADSRQRVVFSYVVEHPTTKRITDFCSFYRLESTVLNKGNNLRVAYTYYYATETGLQGAGGAGAGTGAGAGDAEGSAAGRTGYNAKAHYDRLAALINDMLVLAYQAGFDVCNALTLMDNAAFLERCKFRQGDGSLHYYLFNYRTKPVLGGVTNLMEADPERLSGMGIVLL